MDLQIIKKHLGRDWVAVTDMIGDVLNSDIALLNSLNDSVLSNSGKQLRPVLSLLVARACSSEGKTEDASIRYAAASELLHNATLFHDDVADGSDTRRGAPTVNALMGPNVSVLVGDYWLVKAMNVILLSDNDIRAIRIFSKTLGDLAEGEMLQLQKSVSVDTDEQAYLRIIYSKTASLFEAACLSAAVSVGASEILEKAASDYAVALGLAFQIKDDILDYSGDAMVGKPLGVDILEQKITAPLLCALDNVAPEQQERIRVMVKEIPAHPEYREEIIAFVKANNGVEGACRMLDVYIEKAVDALRPMPESFEKQCLTDLAHYVAIRNK